jgi:hypothetical protein
LKASKVDWIKLKNIISRLEDKVDELENSEKDKERKYEQNRKDLLGIIKRPNLQIMGIEA